MNDWQKKWTSLLWRKSQFNNLFIHVYCIWQMADVIDCPAGSSRRTQSATSQYSWNWQWRWLTCQFHDQRIRAQSYGGAPVIYHNIQCAATFTDQAIRWPAAASRHRPLLQVQRCPSCPSYWRRSCASWASRHRSLHQTAPDPPSQAAPGWAQPEASGSHNSFLKRAKKRRILTANIKVTGV